MKKVSFDFDDTLDRECIQEYAKELINKGIEIWVCTSRYTEDTIKRPGWNNTLFKVTDKLNIPRERIIFAEMKDKYKVMKDIDFVWHLDDDWAELDMLNENTNIWGISSYGTNNWKKKCNKLLEL